MGVGCWMTAAVAWGQNATLKGFSLEQRNDTMSVLVLRTDSTCDRWELPYPVYQFCTGDVDSDGSEDAMVGVIKSTRYFKEKGRRLFIFKNYHGLVRPLWMGSKLGGHPRGLPFHGRQDTELRAHDRREICGGGIPLGTLRHGFRTVPCQECDKGRSHRTVCARRER